MQLPPQHAADFYKTGHIFQYPEGTEYVYSNFTPRSSRLAPVLKDSFDDKVVFVGLQGFIKWFLIDLWNTEFFQKPKHEVLAAYRNRMDRALGVGAVPLDHIESLWELGYLPIEIKALPEGSRVPMKVPVLTVVNTIAEFYWLTNYIETVLSAELWQPCTVATIAYEYRKLFQKYAEETGASLDFINFQGHDFSMRGMGGLYNSASSAVGHLLSFWGTDNISCLDYLDRYYSGKSSPMLGCSVPATEHSVMCMGGEVGEYDTFKRLISEVYPQGVVSIVSDTWDFWNVINVTAPALYQEIMSRNGKVVFRPDSGDPVEILCGIEIQSADSIDHAKDMIVERVREETAHGEIGESEPNDYFRINGEIHYVELRIDWNRYDKQYYYMDGEYLQKDEIVQLTPQQKGAVECLWDNFSGTTNAQGYRTLDSHVGLIYGDSITLERAQSILKRLKNKGFASDNVVFGIGSYTYNYITRDSFGFAVKATWGQVFGEGRNLFKDPITDSGTKKSAKGLLRVEKVNGEFKLFDEQTHQQEQQGELRTVFLNGLLTLDERFECIRERLQNS